jgi:hypothetical protein
MSKKSIYQLAMEYCKHDTIMENILQTLTEKQLKIYESCVCPKKCSCRQPGHLCYRLDEEDIMRLLEEGRKQAEAARRAYGGGGRMSNIMFR